MSLGAFAPLQTLFVRLQCTWYEPTSVISDDCAWLLVYWLQEDEGNRRLAIGRRREKEGWSRNVKEKEKGWWGSCEFCFLHVYLQESNDLATVFYVVKWESTNLNLRSWEINICALKSRCCHHCECGNILKSKTVRVNQGICERQMYVNNNTWTRSSGKCWAQLAPITNIELNGWKKP